MWKRFLWFFMRGYLFPTIVSLGFFLKEKEILRAFQNLGFCPFLLETMSKCWQCRLHITLLEKCVLMHN